MKTYQDLLAVGENKRARMEFIEKTIRDHKSTVAYQTAEAADAYYRHENPTITRYEKFIYDMAGRAVRDPFSPNHKIASNWYFYFTVQAVQYLLGNGATFKEQSTKDRLGKDFDTQLQRLATYSKNGGVAFGFFNNDHLDVFSLLEFAPLKDEEDGSIKAGVRFWQIDDTKPLRAVLYELDGYTSYIKRKGKDMEILHDKRRYKHTVVSNDLGEEILDGENYPGFPIVPLYNVNERSDLCGNRGTIDAYDLLSSKFVNNVSEGDLIYWIIKNCDGMDDVDDIQFVERLRTIHVAHANGGNGADVDAHTVETPYESNEAVLARLEKQLYKDFMGLNVEEIQAGNVTATQIKAAYEPLNQKTDLFEYQVIEFIDGILEIAGIDDEVSFTRSQIANQTEQTQMVMTAANYLDDEAVLDNLPFLTSEQVEEILKRKAAEDSERLNDFAEIGAQTDNTDNIPATEE